MATTQEHTAQAGPSAGPTWRMADASVLILVVLAVIGGFVLRAGNLNATQPASFEKVTFVVPKGAVTTSGPGSYVATTDGGLTVRVEKLPIPPTGSDDVGLLTAARALDLGKQRELFHSSGTNEVQVAGKTSGLLEYQYVESGSDQIFATGLRVIEGRELLIPGSDSIYALSLAGPSDQRDELDSLWPAIQSSISLKG